MPDDPSNLVHMPHYPLHIKVAERSRPCMS